MGPGILLKAVLRSSFSLMVFGYANVLMDIQPLVAMTSGQGALHGWTHTWWAALVIGGFAGLSGKWLADGVLRWFAPVHDRPQPKVGPWIAFVSAYIGTLSHVALDSIVHPDVHPFAPWSDARPWLGAVSSGTIEAGCLIFGFVGTVLYLVGLAFERRRANRG